MATLTLRNTKGSALTFTEMDNNFSNLNTDKLEDITGQSIGDLSDVDTAGVTDTQILIYNSTSGNFEVGDQPAAGISNVVEDTTPQLGGNLDVNGNSIVSASNGNISITPDGTGSVVLDGLNWPQADGTADYVLKTDGAGNLGWVAQSAAGISNVVEDTTPQLGGDLDGQDNVVSAVEFKDYKETVNALGSNDSPSIDAANGNVQSVTITSGLTIPDISNFDAGATMTLFVTGSGSATDGTTSSICKFANAGATTLTSYSLVSIFNDGTNYFVSIATDFA